MPVAILAIALPFLVDIERVELRGRDRVVLGRLRELSGGDAQVAYGLLPEDLLEQVTLLEFADVWQRLCEAGELAPSTDPRSVTWRLRGGASSPSD